MRILLVAPMFPPHRGVASLRTYSFAATWAAAGHDVTVLTTPKRPDQLGLDFQPGAFVENISKDGSSAATTVNAAKLVLNPPALAALLPKGEKLITVEMVGAQAAVGAQVVTLTNKVVTAPTTVTSLPRTGANLPLTGAAAAALIGLAMVARRRRMAHIAE